MTLSPDRSAPIPSQGLLRGAGVSQNFPPARRECAIESTPDPVLALRFDCVSRGYPEPVADPLAPVPVDSASAPSDAMLMAAIAAGQDHALGQLYDRHCNRLMGLAVSILRHRGDAEDLVHDVFVEVWQDAASYRAELSAVGSWLMTRLRFRAIDRLRKLEVARKHQMKSQPREEPQAPPSQTALAKQSDPLKQLSEPQRSVLYLMYYRGLSCREIADRLSVPIGTVKSRLSAGLDRLREQMAETPA